MALWMEISLVHLVLWVRDVGEVGVRPNVEVNRRAEGTSELNRRLGDGAKGSWALERCGAAGDYGRCLAGKQARCGGWWADRGMAGQQPGNAAGARGGGTAEARARPNVLLEGRGAGLPAERPSRSDC